MVTTVKNRIAELEREAAFWEHIGEAFEAAKWFEPDREFALLELFTTRSERTSASGEGP